MVDDVLRVPAAFCLMWMSSPRQPGEIRTQNASW